jgi:hypothetical protein
VTLAIALPGSEAVPWRTHGGTARLVIATVAERLVSSRPLGGQ